MAEKIFIGVYILASACAFFFGYGMIEDLMRQWLRTRHSRKIREFSPLASPLHSPKNRGNGYGDSLSH